MVRGRSAWLSSLGLLVILACPALRAQELGPHVRQITAGIYVYAEQAADSNVGIILSKEGVVLVDSGHTPTVSHAVLKVVKQLTPLPIRFIINTEPHSDHTTGHFVFSPPATIVAHAGAADSMRKAYDPARNKRLIAENPALGEVLKDFRLVTPHVEYQQKMTLSLGERRLELLYLKNVHSEADTAIWLPNERVLFSAAVAGVKRFSNLRPFVQIPDMLAAMTMMKGLDPEIVVPGHGAPGTTKIFDDATAYYTLLTERVAKLAAAGRTLEQIKAEVQMPEADDWALKAERFSTNVEAAYRAVTKK